ncbi:MAG: hypothetical protein RLZZ203_1589, partial [Cyanobacteriota bacterium]
NIRIYIPIVVWEWTKKQNRLFSVFSHLRANPHPKHLSGKIPWHY